MSSKICQKRQEIRLSAVGILLVLLMLVVGVSIFPVIWFEWASNYYDEKEKEGKQTDALPVSIVYSAYWISFFFFVLSNTFSKIMSRMITSKRGAIVVVQEGKKITIGLRF